MTVVHPSSISGISSLTTAASSEVLSFHINNTSERLRITAGGMNVTGVVTATSFDGPVSSATGDFSIADAIVHTGDTDTKIRFPGANQITFETGGVQRLELNNYGTYQPATVPLAFLATSGDSPNIKSGGTNANDLLFTAGNTERLRINSSGQLITGGTATPYATRSLTVQNVTGQTNTYISVVAGSTSGVSGITFGDAAGGAAGNYAGMFEYYHSDDSLRYAQNASEKLRITNTGRSNFYQDNGSTNNAYAVVSEFNAKTSGSAAANFGPALYLTHTFGGTTYAGSLITSQTDADVNTTHISFFPRNYGWTEALRITKDGRVGIGEDTPLSQLEIGGATNATFQISPADGNTGESRIFIGGNSSNQNKCAIIHDPAGGYCRGNLHFCLENSGDTSNVDSSDSKVVIMSNGQMGLGTNSPTALLHVSGGSSPTILNKPTDATPALFVGDSNRSGNGQHLAEYRGLWNGTLVSRMVFSAGDDTSNKDNGNIDFYTAAAGSTALGLRIDSSGRVLISGQSTLSSTSLSFRLQVKSQNDANAIAIIGRDGDDIGELAYYEADKSTKLGEVQYRQDHANIRHRVGDIRFATAGTTERLRISSDGAVYVNSSNNSITAQAAFYAHPSSGCASYRPHASNPVHHFYSNAGGTYSLESYVNGNGSYSDLSDYRLKENIVSISNGISIVKQLNPVKFDWKSSAKPKDDPGFIAHEVQALIPTAVDGTKDQVKEDGSPFYQAIAQAKIIPYLTAALKEAIAKIETLETKVAALEGS